MPPTRTMSRQALRASSRLSTRSLIDFSTVSAMLFRVALSFGNGYYIHGTLYRRLLGQRVTHGCVRLGDNELEQVYRTAPTGTPIFIY